VVWHCLVEISKIFPEKEIDLVATFTAPDFIYISVQSSLCIAVSVYRIKHSYIINIKPPVVGSE